jgi:hypothetical protein
MKKPMDTVYEWRITLKLVNGQAGAPSMTGARRTMVLGRVRARTAEEAINTAVREFGIDEAHRNRLIATRVE